VLSNIADMLTVTETEQLVELGCIPALCDLLDGTLLHKKAALSAILNILRAYKENEQHEYNPYALSVVEAGGLVKLQFISMSEDEDASLRQSASEIESSFFGEKYLLFRKQHGTRVKSIAVSTSPLPTPPSFEPDPNESITQTSNGKRSSTWSLLMIVFVLSLLMN
jgi:hypothetical protein